MQWKGDNFYLLYEYAMYMNLLVPVLRLFSTLNIETWIFFMKQKMERL